MSRSANADIEPAWISSDPRQGEVYAKFLKEMSGQWVWLYRSVGNIGGLSTGQYSALLSPNRAQTALNDPGWEVHIGSGGYGFSQGYADGDTVTQYERFPGEGTELLVLRRDFHGVRAAESEIVEELRLLFNLWEDRATRTYYYFDDAGDPVKAVVVDGDGVRALTNLVRRYQAAKQMHLALYLDSTHFSHDLDGQKQQWEHPDHNNAVIYYFSDDSGVTGKPFSRLFGKRLFSPPAIEVSELWPFEKPEQHESFLIGADENGKEVSNTSNPDELANYFGANRDSPHYLTPVYFRREVLNKYYADTDRYSIEDGYLRCAALWGLRLDNDQPGHVMVFLGDLGRDIPYSEARYWRSFNILPPEEGPSETLVRRAFLGQFTDPKSMELRFPRAYRETNEAWQAAFGEPLFQRLHDDDRHVMSKLHIPISDGQAEFDEQILYLAKLLVDSLNEVAITGGMAKGPKDEKGLAKLQRFLVGRGVADARSMLGPLASIQGLRSRGAAHRKGSSFDIKAALGDLDRREGFKKLLTDAVGTLEALKKLSEEQRT